jgi:RHS repeat-associated protein
MQDREWSSTEGLDWEDFGARMYDPVVGRWWSVDPLAQSFANISPYASLFNNPISFIDPTGMAPEWHWEGNDLVSDQGDDINTLNAFLFTTMNIQIDWQQNNWDSQTGSKTEYPHINALFNLYKSKGGIDGGVDAGQVRLNTTDIEGFMKGGGAQSGKGDYITGEYSTKPHATISSVTQGDSRFKLRLNPGGKFGLGVSETDVFVTGTIRSDILAKRYVNGHLTEERMISYELDVTRQMQLGVGVTFKIFSWYSTAEMVLETPGHVKDGIKYYNYYKDALEVIGNDVIVPNAIARSTFGQ